MKTKLQFEKILIFFAGVTLALVMTKMFDVPCKNIVRTEYIKGDDVPHFIYKDKPVPYEVRVHDTIHIRDTLRPDTEYITLDIDTALILSDYLSRVEYRDTVKNDSSALIVLNEVVSMNRLQYRDVLFQNRRQTVVYKTMTDGVVLGAGANIVGLTLSAGYKYKRNIFSVTYGSAGIGLNYQIQVYGKD
jgi:hypothetical protein